ncbi:MAG: hypothetical protein R3230_00415 [Nitrosopumilaceae archaeon]|nr:hypothetical protein [Nitrosopumilaceae archaeon]
MSDMNVAKTILSQFGGNRSTYMIGAKNLVALNEKCGGLSMKHMKTTINDKPANYFKVVLNESDLYDLEFGWIHGVNYTVREKVENVFADDLVRIFEDTTKLYLSL